MELTRDHYERAAIAYNAYCKQTGGKSLATGDTLPPFDALRPTIKDAWAASAIALSLSDDREARCATARLCAEIADEIGAAEFPVNTGYCAGSAIAAEIRKRFGLSALKSDSTASALQATTDKAKAFYDRKGESYPDHLRALLDWLNRPQAAAGSGILEGHICGCSLEHGGICDCGFSKRLSWEEIVDLIECLVFSSENVDSAWIIRRIEELYGPDGPVTLNRKTKKNQPKPIPDGLREERQLRISRERRIEEQAEEIRGLRDRLASIERWQKEYPATSTSKSDSTASTTQQNPNPDKLDSCQISLD